MHFSLGVSHRTITHSRATRRRFIVLTPNGDSNKEPVIFEFLFQFCVQNMGAKCFFKMEGIIFILLVDAIKMRPDSRKPAMF